MQIELSRAQKYLDWMKTKLFLDYNASHSPNKNIKNVYRGKVYYCYFGVGIGSEQEKNNRPCVVIQRHTSNLSSPNTIVAPITKSGSKLDVVVPIATRLNSDGSIKLEGHVLLGNIITVSKARLGDYICDLTPDEMKKVDRALSYSVELYPYHKELQDKLTDKINHLTVVKNQRNEAQDTLKELYELLNVSDINSAKQKIQELLK